MTSLADRVRSPYEDPELYDLMLDGLDFDVAYWTRLAKESGGPVLDVGCGTGRVLVRLLEAGIDADGVDNAPAMLERCRARAAAIGGRPGLALGDMRSFELPRRYALVICAFNAFAHCDTTDEQLRALKSMRAHLAPGGSVALHMSWPRPSYWSEEDGVPVLELETRDPRTGRRLQMWDTRFKDPVAQRQHSKMEMKELDEEGRVLAVHRSETTQRWVYRWELELLFRAAGFTRWEIAGGFAGETLSLEHCQMVARAFVERA